MLPIHKIVSLVDNPCNPDSRVVRMAESLTDFGHSVTIVCKFADSLPSDEVANGVRYVRVPMRARPLRPRSGLFKFGAFASYVRDTVLALKPTVIHANDLIALPSATRLAAELGAKVVYDVHDLYLHGPKRRSRLAFWQGEKIERSNIRMADAVVTVSNGIADHLHRVYGIERPEVILNAPIAGTGRIDNPTRRLRDEIGLAPGQPLGVYTGGRSVSGGLDRLIRAMAEVPELHIAMVGHAQSAHDLSLSRIAIDCGCADRLHLLPPVPHAAVTNYIASADFGVLPYQIECLNHQYSMPHKLLEAVFAGLPVAVSNLHELRLFVESTETGIVMNALNPADMARALRLLVSRRGQLRLSQEKVSALVDVYGWPAQATTLRGVYDRLLLRRRDTGHVFRAA